MFDVAARKELARCILATRDVRLASGYAPVSYDFRKSWLRSAREVCDDEQTAILLNLMLAGADLAGTKGILDWAARQ